jgi:hypothetical protein
MVKYTMTEERKPITLMILPERVNFVFANYEEGIHGMVLASELFAYIEGTELEGSVRFSFDNEGDNPLMSVTGPAPLMSRFVDVLAGIGTKFVIDPSTDDIVARKFKNSSGSQDQS